MAKNNNYYLGIDFGTCNIKAARCANGRVRPIKLNKNQSGNAAAPNVIFYDYSDKTKQIEKKIGEPAMRSQRPEDEKNKVYNIKRKLELPSWSQYIDNLKKEVDAPTVLLDMFSKMNEIILEQRHDKQVPMLTTLTVPVSFSKVQRDIMWQTAKKAGFNIQHVITEPFAALFSQEDLFSDEEVDENVVVFDFGGMTLDLSLIHVENDGEGNILVEELSTVGMHFGGLDIDQLIYEDILQKKYAKEISSIKKADDLGTADRELLKKVTSLKEMLFEIDVGEDEADESITDRKGKMYTFTLMKDEVIHAFNQHYCQDRIRQLLDELFEAQSDVNPDEVTRVCPFGGSSNIQYFLEVLTDYFGEDIFDAEEYAEDAGGQGDDDALYLAIARGAARYTQFTEEVPDIEIHQAIPFNVGVVRNGQFITLLQKNETALISRKEAIPWAELKQQQNHIAIYQTFSNAMNLPAGSSEVIYIGEFALNSKKYDASLTPMFNMRFDAQSNLVIQTWQQRPDKDEPDKIETFTLPMGV